MKIIDRRRTKVETSEDLPVRQKGMEMDRQVLLLGQEGTLSKDLIWRDWWRRAALSIPTTSAAGVERASQKEYLSNHIKSLKKLSS
jgi:hypothetical protein